jgi:acetoin:2,6-dichlorophenolindophenol oxidoreductase subunit alpha
MEMRPHLSELGDLALPANFTAPLDIAGESEQELLEMFREMTTIRQLEEVVAELDRSGEAKCPCHLGIGQEGAAVGVASHLEPSDRAFGAHRSHSHFLAMGGSLESILAEILGKVTGSSKGMGGSMHLFGKDFGFYGSVPIVGGTIPLAVGAALASKMDRKGTVAVAFFGDGSSEEGALHESLNLASQYQLPILFVCENNLYSSHLDISQRQPSDSIARFARAHQINTEVVDGNDVLAVKKATGSLLASLREGKGPGFLEAVTYRWRGHVGPDENIDVGVRRKASDIAAWKKRDPIGRLTAALKLGNPDLEGTLAVIYQQVSSDIQDALALARKAPYPAQDQNLSSVYFRAES